MSLAGKVGRRGRLFVEEESTFGTLVNATGAGIVRHLDFGGAYDPFGKVNSEEKKQSPWIVNEHDRRATASWDLKSAYLIPSGALNSLCEASKFLEHGLGSKRSVTLSTTVASGASTSGATLTSATGLAVDDFVLINLTGGSFPGLYVRRLATVNTGTGAATWTIPLPSAVQVGNTVKGGVTYKLITGEAAKSLSISRYVDATLKYAWVGCVIEQLKLMFNANDDYKFAASGPAVEQIPSGSVASAPGSVTTVGTKPVSGISGLLEIGSAATVYKALKFEAALKNGYVMRNESLGYTKGEEFYREGMGEVTLAIDARVEDPTVVYDNAITGTDIPVQLMAGRTEGKIFVVHAPLARFDVPDTPDGVGALTWSFQAKCKESADGANDPIFVAAF